MEENVSGCFFLNTVYLNVMSIAIITNLQLLLVAEMYVSYL